MLVHRDPKLFLAVIQHGLMKRYARFTTCLRRFFMTFVFMTPDFRQLSLFNSLKEINRMVGPELQGKNIRFRNVYYMESHVHVREYFSSIFPQSM